MNRTATVTAFDTGSSSRVVGVHGYAVRHGIRFVDVTLRGVGNLTGNEHRMTIPATDVYVVTQASFRPATDAETAAWLAGHLDADARETEHGLMIRDDES